MLFAIPIMFTFPPPLIEEQTFHFLLRLALSCRNSGVWAAATLSADSREPNLNSQPRSAPAPPYFQFSYSLPFTAQPFISISFHLGWFGRGGSGGPLFPGRLETKSGPGAAASAASEPEAEMCTATLSRAKALPSHTHRIIPQGASITRLHFFIRCKHAQATNLPFQQINVGRTPSPLSPGPCSI